MAAILLEQYSGLHTKMDTLFSRPFFALLDTVLKSGSNH